MHTTCFFSDILNSKDYSFLAPKIRKNCQVHINKYGNPLKKKFILFPCNQNNHWRLFVVANCESTKGNESDIKIASDDALKCILHIDSFASDPPKTEVTAIQAIMYNFHYLSLEDNSKPSELLTKHINNFWTDIE